jgi:hypothetical protein
MSIDILIRKTLAVFCCGVLSCCAFAAGNKTGNQSCNLPFEAQSILNTQLPAWKIVELSDLSKDDQELWTKKRSGACPGLARGHFRGPLTSYGVTLIRRKGKRTYQTLVLLEENNKSYKLTTLSPAQITSRICVTFTVPPDSFDDLRTRKTIRTRTESIAYEDIEAGMWVYAWRKGHFQGIVVTD